MCIRDSIRSARAVSATAPQGTRWCVPRSFESTVLSPEDGNEGPASPLGPWWRLGALLGCLGRLLRSS
eukprot:6969696-Pyramimonas_sp.AAC.1